MKKFSLFLDALCALLWIIALIVFCITGTLPTITIICALILAIGYFIQNIFYTIIFDFSKK